MLASSYALSTNPTTQSHVQLLLALFLFVLDSLNLHRPSVNTWPCSTLVIFLYTLCFIGHPILYLNSWHSIYQHLRVHNSSSFSSTHQFSEPHQFPARNPRQKLRADSPLIAWLESDFYTVTASCIA